MKKFLNLGLGLLAAATVTCAGASEYPTRPITFLTMTQPGAQIDRLTRGLAQRMSGILGQPINVKNVTGSHGHRPVYLVAHQGDDAKVWTSALFITFR